MPDRHDNDERLRRALGSPRPLDVEPFTERTMARLREERARRGWLAAWLAPARPLRWAIPALGAAAVLFALIAMMNLNQQGGDHDGTNQMAAILTPTPTTQIASATPVISSATHFGPPVPRAAAALADTNPETILLEGSTAIVAQNDPTMRPHSIWDQPY